MDLITLDLKNGVITALIGLTTYYLVKLYMRVASYAPEPGLPLLTELLRAIKEHSSYELAKLRHKYVPVVKFWMENTPFFLIYDSDLARDAFKQNAFSGRPDSFIGKVFSNNKSSDVIMDDYGHRWENLRRVAHSAVVSEVVDETVALIDEKERTNKPFNILDYNYRMFLNIATESGFEKRYKVLEYKQFKYFFFDFQSDHSLE